MRSNDERVPPPPPDDGRGADYPVGSMIVAMNRSFVPVTGYDANGYPQYVLGGVRHTVWPSGWHRKHDNLEAINTKHYGEPKVTGETYRLAGGREVPLVRRVKAA